MAVQSAQITVGTSPVELTIIPTDRQAGSAIVLTAPPSADLFVGGPDVTTGTGFRVAAGTTLAGDLQSGERLYGVLGAGSGVVHVLRSGV